jgi:SAM-dependent methyltransferase
MSEFVYVGTELDLFALAQNWKAYWHSQIREFLRGDVLEVGAGLGSNTQLLRPASSGRWVCLEPDPILHAKLEEALPSNSSGRNYFAICGTLSTVRDQRFDCILYIDVLEHIENDRAEMEMASSCLKPGGHLIVLSPAHQFLYTPFDKAIGHFRRYTRRSLRQIASRDLHCLWIRYLDCVGMTASAANLLLLRQSMPTASQISLWDGVMVPLSRLLDRVFCYKVGKTVIGVWEKR